MSCSLFDSILSFSCLKFQFLCLQHSFLFVDFVFSFCLVFIDSFRILFVSSMPWSLSFETANMFFKSNGFYFGFSLVSLIFCLVLLLL